MKRETWRKLLSLAISIHLTMGLVPTQAWAEAVTAVQDATTQTEEVSLPAFEQSAEAGGVTLTMRAEPDALPADAVLDVHVIEDEQLVDAEAAVAEVREEIKPQTSYFLDLSVLDANGDVLQPSEGHEAEVTLAPTESAIANQSTRVYALTFDEDGHATAEPIDVVMDSEAGTVTVHLQTITPLVLELYPDKTEQGTAADTTEGGQPETKSETESEAKSEAEMPDTQGTTSTSGSMVSTTEISTVEESSSTDSVPSALGTVTAPSATATQNTSTSGRVRARSTTRNIVGQVFANMANRMMEHDEADTTTEEPTLNDQPLESHDPSYYANTNRLRRLVGANGSDVGFIVYRDSFHMVPRDQSDAYEVTYTEDERTAYITPAIDPALLADKTGIVLLRDDVGTDEVLVFDGTPTLEGDTLVVPLAATDDLTLNQLFCDGSLKLSTEDSTVSTKASTSSGMRALGTQSVLAPQAINPWPSGTNWKASISNFKPERLDLDVDIDIFKLKFDLVLGVGVSFDFDVTSTGATPEKESRSIADISFSAGVFKLGYECLFEAQFNSVPVHMTGNLNSSLDYHMNPIFGVHIENFRAPLKLKSFELTNPTRDANKDIDCYVGTGFHISQGFFAISVDLLFTSFTIGPILSLNHYSCGGSTITGRFEKNTYNPTAPDRTKDVLHTCAADGRNGCYVLHARESSLHDIFFQIDLYFKKWPFSIHNQHKDSIKEVDYYNSLAYGTGLREGVCPHRLFRVPVQVLAKDGNNFLPVPNMDVTCASAVSIEGVQADEKTRYIQDVSDEEGRADLFLPYKYKTRYTLVANGRYADNEVIGSAMQPSEMKAALNDTANIYIQSTEQTLVEGRAVWDSDLDGQDNTTFHIAVQMRCGPDDDWSVIGWTMLNKDEPSMRQKSDGGDAGPWTWSHSWPKYSLQNGKFVANEFRVLQLKEYSGPVGTSTALMSNWNTEGYTHYQEPQSLHWYLRDDSGASEQVSFSDSELQAIETEVQARAVLPDSESPYVDYKIHGYTDSRGLIVPEHRTAYRVSYDHTVREDDTASVQLTTMTNLAVADVDLNKVWNLTDGNTQLNQVYLALLQRPYDEWNVYAREVGVPTEWVPALNPVEGSGNTLRELMRSGVIGWANVYNIEDVPLGIAKVTGADDWGTNFKVRKYRNGVPLRFMGSELNNDVLHSLLIYEYGSDQIVGVRGAWTGASIPGETYAGLTSAQQTANVTNSDGDPAHTIGGTIHWYIGEQSTTGSAIPDHVTIHVRDQSGAEVGSVRVNRSDFGDSPVWSWSLTGENIHSYETYTIYEQLESGIYVEGVEFISWFAEVDGLDVVNHYIWNPYLGVTIEASIDALPENVPTGDPLQVELHDENGGLVGTYSLAYNTGTKGYDSRVVYSQSDNNSPFVNKDIYHYSVVVKNPEVSSTTDEVVPTYTTSVEYAPYYTSNGRVDVPKYTFHVTNVVQAAVRPSVEVKWVATDDNPIPNGQIPDSVTFDLYCDDVTAAVRTAERVYRSEGWTKTVNGTSSELPHIRNDGVLHTWRVEPSEVRSFRSNVSVTGADTATPRFTITYTYLGSASVDVKGTVNWTGDEGHESFRPESVRVAIVAQSENDTRTARTVQTAVVSVPCDGTSNSTDWLVKDLPRYDVLGRELRYSVLQSEAYGYTAAYTAPTFDEATRTWTCDVTNELTGYYTMSIRKKVAGAPTDQNEEYRFTVSAQNDDTPRPVTDTLTIRGAGEGKAEFLLGADGLYFYTVKENAGTDASCVYDSSEKYVLLVKTTDQDGKSTISSWVGEKKSGDAALPGTEVVDGNETEATAEQTTFLEALRNEQSNVVEFTNRYPGISIEKKWDIDLEGKDRPDSVEFALQRKNGNTWGTVEVVKLSAADDWKKSLPLPGGTNDAAEYRVRELKEETLLQSLLASGADGFSAWLNDNGSSLPPQAQTWAQQGYDTLVKKLADSNVVYDKGDADKPSGDGVKTNEVTFHVSEYTSALAADTVEAHTTKYRVSYTEKKDGSCHSFSITDTAVLEIDVIKRWVGIGVDDADMPDAAWVVLLAKPKAGTLDAAASLASTVGVDISGVLNYEFPAINPLEGGNDPISIISELALGVDLNIFSKLGVVPKLAIGRVTKDKGWKYPVAVKKYASGIPMEYKGAELGSEIIRQIVKYLTKLDLPLSYNPFQNFVSVPTRAVRTPLGQTDLDLSKLSGAALERAKGLTAEQLADLGPSTLLDDWHLMANVINIKVDFDNSDPDDQDDPDDDIVRGQKSWDDLDNRFGLRPQTVTVRLMADGKEVASAQTSAEAGWRYVFPGRPQTDEDGRRISYTVSEDPVEGYETVVDGLNITNRLQTAEVTVTKVWDDGNDQDGKRPNAVTVALYANGTEVDQKQIGETDGWKCSFGMQPRYSRGGAEIHYTVTEKDVTGYQKTVTNNGYNFTVTNTHKPETTSLRVTKAWDDADNQDGIRPNSVTVDLYADGVKVDSQELTEQGGWQYVFADKPVYKDGQKITYTVDEASVLSGYVKTVNGLTITNKHTPAVRDVTVNKVWSDSNNQDGKRPSSVTVRLRANGQEVESHTLNADNGWAYTFTDKPVYQDGRQITYTVSEDLVDDYTSSVSGNADEGFTITNAHTPGKTQVNVYKLWIDDANRDGKRPASVTVRLLAGGVDTGKMLELSAANDWSDSFTDLDEKSDGAEIAYTVKEDQVEGYTTSYYGGEGVAENSYLIVNTYKSETVTIRGKKVWDDQANRDGLRPESVRIWLVWNGTRAAYRDVSSSGDGTFDFGEFYKNAPDGTPNTFTVEEEPVDGYTCAVTGSVDEGFTVTNTHVPETFTVEVYKVWDDWDNQDGKRPAYTTIHLFAKGEDTKQTITLNEDGGWTGAFGPLYKNDGGEPIDYWITETRPDSYTSKTYNFSDDTQGLFLVVDSYDPEKVTIAGSKTWDDHNNKDGVRPQSIRVWLLSNGLRIGFRDVTANDGWAWDFGSFFKYRNGQQVKYGIEEEPVDGYTSAYSEDRYDVTNTHVPDTVDVDVSKAWYDGDDQDGKRPSSVTVRLLADGQDTGKTLELNEENRWRGSFLALDEYAEGSVKKPVTYTVEELAVPGYQNEVTGSADDGFVISNTHVPETVAVRVNKVWDDEGDRERIRPDSVTLRLLADGEEVEGSEVELTADDGWTHVYPDLPAYAEGKKISYTVEEDPVEGYTAEVSGDTEGVLTVTNTHVPETHDIDVRKVWDDREDHDGIRPDSVTVRLLANGEDTGRAIELREAGDWAGAFEGLYVYDGAKEVAYTVEEDPVEGYTTEVSGGAEGGFTVTNRHVPDVVPPGPEPVTYAITYDLNGGTYQGLSGPIVQRFEAGTTITIHDAPVRKGYRFTYWKGSKYLPGDSYTVEGDHTFVAQWEKDGEPVVPDSDVPDKTTPTPSTRPAASFARTQALARTADGSAPQALPATLAALGLALCLVARMRRRMGVK